MGQSDFYGKELFQWDSYFADLVNNVLFDGKILVKPDELKELDATELTFAEGEVKRQLMYPEDSACVECDVAAQGKLVHNQSGMLNPENTNHQPSGGNSKNKNQKHSDAENPENMVQRHRDVENPEALIQRHRDVLKQAVIRRNDTAIFAIIGVENQTFVHYAMPVRNLLYDAIRYMNQVEKVSKQNRKIPRETGRKLSGAEFLSGWGRTDKLLPVITITVFFGADRWDGPLSLHDMMDDSIPADIFAMIPDYRMHLLEPAAIKDWSHFTTDIGILFQMISVSKKRNGIADLVNSDPDRFRHVDNKVMRAINFYTKAGISISEDEETTDMCYAMQTYRDEILDEGIEKGIKEGHRTGISEGKIIGFDDRLFAQIQKKLAKGKTIDQIADELEEEIVEVERVCRERGIII